MAPPSVRARLGELPRPRIGATARRITFAILVTALIPSVSTLVLARTIIRRITDTAFQPEFGQHLDQSLGVYADLAKALKGRMRAEADAIAETDALRDAAAARDRARMEKALGAALEEHPSLASAIVESCAGERLAMRERGPIDRAKERAFTVRRTLGQAPTADCEGDGGLVVATFTAPAARFAELESAQAFAQAYHQIEGHHRDEYLSQTYLDVFFVVIAMTLALGALAGVLVARPVTQRIARLAEATGPVAAGDLSVRVALGGRDEVTALGSAFNHMLEELERSRERIDFLRRMGEWQKMARRLAHEIKNPLTPIQLAVEECHRRYPGDDASYKRILQTTLEVVEEEVGSLRRLVGEFSSFARLPRAELASGDLGEFLRDEREHLGAASREPGSFSPSFAEDAAMWGSVEVAFDVPDVPLPAELDREMMHRVLRNLVKNAAQALRDARPAGAAPPWGHVRVGVEVGVDAYVLTIDDDGPGIPADVRATLFDPYVTTKRDGTGLGLSIVKKIVVDHGGSIEATDGPLGGARFRVTLPRPGTPAARAAAWNGGGAERAA
ncbi:MAG TPA: ATP-binding protein [Minicystis sp.]|nr:ATP-binding protein [Minicystis sp.]